MIAVAEAIPFAELTRGLARAAVRAEGRDRLRAAFARCSGSRCRSSRSGASSTAPCRPARSRGCSRRDEARYRRHFETLHAARGVSALGCRPADSEPAPAEAARRSVHGARLAGRGGATAGRNDRARAHGLSRRRRVSVHLLVLRSVAVDDRRADASRARCRRSWQSVLARIDGPAAPIGSSSTTRATSSTSARFRLRTCRESRRSRRRSPASPWSRTRTRSARGRSRSRDSSPGGSRSPIGLETIHPACAASGSTSASTSARFDWAARFLARERHRSARLRAPRRAVRSGEESVAWTVRAVEYAVERGAAVVSIIPVRGGNGEMERLAGARRFHAADVVAARGRARRLPADSRTRRGHGRPVGRRAAVRRVSTCRARASSDCARVNATGRAQSRGSPVLRARERA